MPHTEDLGRNNPGIEFHVVPVAMPQIAGVTQKIVYLIGHLMINPQVRQGKFHPSCLRVMGIQIYHDHYNV